MRPAGRRYLGRGRAARGARVIYNGVAAPPVVLAPRATVNAPRLAYVGRLSPRKGVDVAIATVSELADRGVRSTLTIVGDTFPATSGTRGTSASRSRRTASENASPSPASSPASGRCWRTSTSCWFPPEARSRLATVIEAALSGRPVVACNHSGLQEAMSALRAAVAVPAGDLGPWPTRSSG